MPLSPDEKEELEKEGYRQWVRDDLNGRRFHTKDQMHVFIPYKYKRRGDWTEAKAAFWYGYQLAKKRDKNVNPFRRKSIASGRNPSVYKSAREMAEAFHGRKVEQVIEVEELEKEPTNLAVIGDLIELCVIPKNEDEFEYPISFDEQADKKVTVCCDKEGKQIYFVGGDQDLDEIIRTLCEKSTQRYVVVGYCKSICYFTDKHHLEGDEEQKYGVPYEHEFGEQGGHFPMLVYDADNKRMMLAGGTYEVRDVGIWD